MTRQTFPRAHWFRRMHGPFCNSSPIEKLLHIFLVTALGGLALAPAIEYGVIYGWIEFSLLVTLLVVSPSVGNHFGLRTTSDLYARTRHLILKRLPALPLARTWAFPSLILLPWAKRVLIILQSILLECTRTPLHEPARPHRGFYELAECDQKPDRHFLLASSCYMRCPPRHR